MIDTQKAQVALLSKQFVMQGIMVSSTVLAGVAARFPDISLTGIQMIMNLCMLAAFPMNILAGFLCNRFSMRRLSIIFLALLSVGGLIPAFFNTSIYHFYLSSILLGIAMGTLRVTIPTITTLLFEGDARSKMFGRISAFDNIGQIVLMLLAGWLAVYGWERAYLSLFIVPVALIIVIIFMPKIDIPHQKAEEMRVKAEKKPPVPRVAVFAAFLGLLFYASNATFVLNGSIYIERTGMGNASMVAYCLTAGTIAGVLCGLVFHKLFKAISWHVLTLAALATAASYLIPAFFPSVFSVYLVGTITGGTFALFSAGLHQVISVVCAEDQVSGAMGIAAAFGSAGAFSSPFIMNALATLGVFSGAAEGAVFMASGSFAVALAVLIFIWNTITMPKYRGKIKAAAAEETGETAG